MKAKEVVFAPPKLLDPGQFPVDMAVDQVVVAEHEGGSASFRAIVEKKGRRLVLVGLAPHGGRGFVVTQEGEHLSFQSYLPDPLPFAPEFMMADVHRTWLVGLMRPGCSAFKDGEYEGVSGEEHFIETWRGGRLRSRRFRSLHSERAGWWKVDIRYEGGLAPNSLPERVVIEAVPFPGRFYRLTLTSLSGHFELEGKEMVDKEGLTRVCFDQSSET
ncbi:MAG: DUF3261 domain-containing protein [Sandaracinaceae bacterium]|nr:DUF3261 domain-containing protein [Sandaracinaceae bacterium]